MQLSLVKSWFSCSRFLGNLNMELILYFYFLLQFPRSWYVTGLRAFSPLDICLCIHFLSPFPKFPLLFDSICNRVIPPSFLMFPANTVFSRASLILLHKTVKKSVL